MMENFHSYITPEQAKDMDDTLEGGRRKPLSYYQALSNNDGVCMNCGSPTWKLVDTGLCFSCTTGESDASSDYELIATNA